MDVIAALSALAQDSRLDAFRLLVKAGPAGMPAGRIAERLGVPSATLSFHLNQLRQAGLIGFRRESRSLIYFAEYETMRGVLGFLIENCCEDNPVACAADMPAPTITATRKGTRDEASARSRRRH